MVLFSLDCTSVAASAASVVTVAGVKSARQLNSSAEYEVAVDVPETGFVP